MRTLPILSAALALLSTSSPAQSAGRHRDSLAILAVVQGIVAADNAGNLPVVLGFCCDSALLLPPNAPPVRGHAAIQPRYEQLFAEYNTPPSKGTSICWC